MTIFKCDRFDALNTPNMHVCGMREGTLVPAVNLTQAGGRTSKLYAMRHDSQTVRTVPPQLH